MLDFGWTELILIMALAILVIGPNEIPALMRGLGRIVRRMQYIKYAIAQQFDDFMKTSEMEDIGRSVNFEESRNRDFDEASADEEIIENQNSEPNRVEPTAEALEQPIEKKEAVDER